MVVKGMPHGYAVSADSICNFRQKVVSDFTRGFFQRNTVFFVVIADVAFFDGSRNPHPFCVKLAAEPPLKPYLDIPRMTTIALEMLRDALDCLLQVDEAKAIAVCKRDSEVDKINRQLYRELTSFMVEKPETISRAIELMFISKSIERIADHATNIAEETIYLSKGKDVRHSDEVKKSVKPEA